MKKSLRIIFLSLFIVIFTAAIAFFVLAANDMQCVFVQNNTCSTNQSRLMGLENSSHLGPSNAHAQNTSFTTYNYSICCNSTNSSMNISTVCPGNVTVVRLSDGTNAHIEIGTNNNAAYSSASACLSSNWETVSCTYTASACPTNYSCILSMAGTEGSNTTNAHVGNCSVYNETVCCGLTNSAPSKPILYYPANGNTSVLERRPNFNWTCTDPENNVLTYSLNLTCGTGCPCADVNIGSITTTNYTVVSALCFNSSYYNWSVTACDSYNACTTSNTSNFTIASTIGLDLPVNSTSFGTMPLGQQNDTTTDNPVPLVARNTGNVLINVTINASALFTKAAMNQYNYMYEGANNQSGSINTGCSQTTFTPMNNASKTNLFCNLSYESTSRTGKLHLNVTVPNDEPGGTKTSIIELTATQTE